MKASDVWVVLSSLLLASTAAAFIPAACEDDPSRTLFAGFGRAPCKEFHGDQAACESAYYVNLDNDAASCAFVAGTCIGCGGNNGACATNTCTGAMHATLAPACAGDPSRTALLGLGDNGSERCRNLDHTDQASCENAYYEQEDDDDLGNSVACFWDTTSGACVGCGDNGSPCPFNQCDPTVEAPDAECTLDSGRTNLLGYGGNGANRCRRLDGTDQATCDGSYYEDEDSELPVACWWDGDECRGSGFSDFFAQNSCLTEVQPPSATATCPLQPARSNLLGFGNNDTGTCRQLDNTDQATCEDAYYEASSSGVSVACWWSDGACRGSFRNYSSQNTCEGGVDPSATCTGRTNLLGFGNNSSSPCRALDATDAPTCEDAFYEHDQTHAAVACWWDGDECRGSTSNFRGNNTCGNTEGTCSLDATRTELLGAGGDGQRACRDLDSTDEATCEAAFYMSFDGAPAPVACWWDGNECRGSIRHFEFNSCLFEEPPFTADATCGQRTNLLGVGENNTSRCRALDDTDEATCEDAYYQNDDTGFPIACWWDGDSCRGSSGSYSENNDCPAEEGECTLDPERSNLLGFGDRNVGQSGGACRQLDGSDQATCEDAFYLNQDDGTAVACWWDEGGDDCKGSSSAFAVNNACLRAAPSPVTCPGRDTSLGFGNNSNSVCRQLDGSSESICEDAFYVDIDGFQPIACIWDDGDCLGTSNWSALNACDPSEEPPTCDSRVLLGKGDDDSAPCRQFDGTSEGVCETAYYVSRDDEPVACWWDGDECRGSNNEFSEQNSCVPPVTCDARSNRLGFGANGSGACGSLDNTDQTTCEDAFYVTADDSRPVACHWDADAGDCDGCNRFRSNSDCEVNACDPVECTGDAGRSPVARCTDLDNEVACEGAWHVIGNSDLPPIAASCFWNAEEQECFGCGPPSQSSRECANECEDGCGNGVLDQGETCDDGNMFPGDCCDSTCQLEPDGAACTDRLFCTIGPGTCQAGVCTGGEPRVCASCLGDDCNENRNECVTDGEGSSRGGAQLQGGGPPPPSDMSFPLPPGTVCDDGVPGTDSTCDDNGMCIGELAAPTPTATSTANPTTTPTRVPVGAPCTDTSQCIAGAACIEGFCSAVAAAAPAASHNSLLMILAALLAIGAFSLRLRREP